MTTNQGGTFKRFLPQKNEISSPYLEVNLYTGLTRLKNIF
jgi:hypothetical protein